LAEAVVNHAKETATPLAAIHFSYEDHDGKISTVESLRGQSGWLSLSRFTVEALDQVEDHLVLSAITDAGQILDEETARRFFSLPANGVTAPGEQPPESLETLADARRTEIRRTISQRNAHFFEQEVEKLESWADDLKLGLEREIKELDRQIREARRAATTALTLEEKLSAQKAIRSLESQRNERRRSLFEAQDKVDAQRGEIISQLEGKLTQQTADERLFVVRWNLT
jgi:adenine-specific DNA-methyltransferase